MSLNGALIYMALCCPQPAFFDSSVSHCRHSESNRNINFAIVPCLSFRVILFCLIIFVSFRLSFHPYLTPPPPKKNSCLMRLCLLHFISPARCKNKQTNKNLHHLHLTLFSGEKKACSAESPPTPRHHSAPPWGGAIVKIGKFYNVKTLMY